MKGVRVEKGVERSGVCGRRRMLVKKKEKSSNY